MSKILISYFSASGVTRSVAKKIAKAVDGDLFEVEPVNKYTDEDLDWTNKNSRSSIEMSDKSSRPQIVNKAINIGQYEKIVIGFPVWWYTAPTIINTFIEETDLNNKNVYVFVTSGGSDSLKSFEDLKSTYPNINFISSKRFVGNESENLYNNWLE